MSFWFCSGSVSRLKALLQAGIHGRVPVPLEKRFLVAFTGAACSRTSIVMRIVLIPLLLVAMAYGSAHGATNAVAPPATMSDGAARIIVENAFVDILDRYPIGSAVDMFVRELTKEGRDEQWLRTTLQNSDNGRLVARARRQRRRVIEAAATLIGTGVLIALAVAYRRRKTTREFVYRVILVGLGVAGCCACAEAALRFKACYLDRRNAAGWNALYDAFVPAPGARVTLENMIRMSPDQQIIYELIPNLDVNFIKASVTTDANGFRVTPTSVSDDRAFRILGLGDSVMFGWGVNDDQTYLAVLGGKLKGLDGGRGVRIINMAVPGYNTVMEVEGFKRYGRKLRPNLVIVNYVENDVYLPNFIRVYDQHTTLTKSYLFAAIAPLVGVKVRTRPFEHFTRPYGEIPEKYKSMVGESAVKRAFSELIGMSREDGFKLMLICTWNMPPTVGELLDNAQIPILKIGPVLFKYLDDHHITTWQGSVLTLNSRDPHFSPLGNAVVADALYDAICKESLISEGRNPAR